MCWSKHVATSAVMIAALIVTGCHQGVIYQADKLPDRYRVPAASNAQTIDLSRLADFTVDSEQIERGDVLEVAIVTGYEGREPPPRLVRIREDGTGKIPLVGVVSLAGLQLDMAEQAIADAAVERGLYRNPLVTATFKQQRINNVTVVGAVAKPGVYPLTRGRSTLLAGIVAAGGLSEEAGTTVEVKRPARFLTPQVGPESQERPLLAGGFPGQLTSHSGSHQPTQPLVQPASAVRINLVSASENGGAGYSLTDGDVVMVTRKQHKPITVMGRVHKPGQFDVPVGKDLRVLDAIGMAGGRSENVSDKVYIVRQVADQEDPVVVQVSVHDAKRSGEENIRLAPGDVVSVEDTVPSVFMDTVQRFVRIGIGATGRFVVF